MNKLDYRTREAREKECLAEVDISGGVHTAWVTAIPARRAAMERLIAAGTLRRVSGTNPHFITLERVQPEPLPWWIRFTDALGNWFGRWA